MNQPQYSEEIDLTEYYKTIYKNKRLIAIFLVLGLIFGYIASILPIYNYRAKAVIRTAMISGGPTEPVSQTAEKVKDGVYGRHPSLSSDYISSGNLVQIWVDDKSEELAKKTISDITDKIIKEQNDMSLKAKEDLTDKINRLKNIMDYFMARGQEVALFQIEIMRTEDQINSIKQAELLGDINALYRKISLQMSLVLGVLFGLVAGILYIFIKDWWIRAKYMIKK